MMKRPILILLSLLLLACMATAQIQRGKKPIESKAKSEQTAKKPKVKKSSSDKKTKSRQSSRSSNTTNQSGSSSSSLDQALQAEPTAYDVAFSCNVAEAEMYIDGNEYGHPKGTRTLKNGIHQVKVVADGYIDYTATINVKADNTNFVFNMAAKVETFTINGVSFDMVWVDGGTFMMGGAASDPDYDNKPAHRVTLTGYYIGKFEVTQELWLAVMDTNPSLFQQDNMMRRPVEQVSWYDCQEFISKLNELTGKCFRLPTEAEWEYAARGGNKSHGYKYAGSNSIDNVAWYYDKFDFSGTHTVGTKAPNELGLYDMTGNVFEWCQDWFGDYSDEAQTNPTGPSSGSKRILRGGAWCFPDELLGVSVRFPSNPISNDLYKEIENGNPSVGINGLRLAM